MLFTLKKIIGGMLLPLPFFLLLMGLALLLFWCSRWKKTAAVLLTASWALLFSLSLQPVADRLLAPLEKHYSTVNYPSNVEYIVVLGGGYTYNAAWAPSSNLLSNNLARVTEGVRQWRLQPQAKLIFTGAATENNSRSSASVAGEVAESLGVPAQKIILLSQPRDTAQEAVAVRQYVGEHRMMLITSANHLPRALNFFRQQQLNPIPVPANQLAISSPINFWQRLIPSSIWLEHSERVWYESLGQLWLSLTSPVVKNASTKKISD